MGLLANLIIIATGLCILAMIQTEKEKAMSEERKWYWFETRFRSLKDGLCNLLTCNNIEYELSGSEYESWWHFEICPDNDYQVDVINDWIDENTITERSA